MSENQSPSYLAMREAVRGWLTSTREGQYATDKLKQFQKPGVHNHASRVLDDDYFTDFEEIKREYADALVLAASNRRAREMFERGEVKPSKGSKLLRIFSPPLSYVLRRQVEEMDPHYWNDERNVLREALANPEWATVPPDYLRGKLEALLPKPKKGQVFDASGALLGEPVVPAARPETEIADPNALILPPPAQAAVDDATIVAP